MQVINEAGYDGAATLARANDAKTKADLRNRTAEAKNLGICGVPSYRVFKKVDQGEEAWKQVGDIVWGQDLLPDVEDFIAGWDETAVTETARPRL